MTEQIYTEQIYTEHTQYFRDLFTKVNKMVSVNMFAVVMTIIMALWASLFSLIYVDMKDHKEIYAKERVEIIRELGEIKILIAKK